jgi:hypothetical protein
MLFVRCVYSFFFTPVHSILDAIAGEIRPLGVTDLRLFLHRSDLVHVFGTAAYFVPDDLDVGRVNGCSILAHVITSLMQYFGARDHPGARGQPGSG